MLAKMAIEYARDAERRTETRTRSGAGNRRERFQKSVSYIYIYIKSENWEINLPKNKEETIVPISLFDE